MGGLSDAKVKELISKNKLKNDIIMTNENQMNDDTLPDQLPKINTLHSLILPLDDHDANVSSKILR